MRSTNIHLIAAVLGLLLATLGRPFTPICQAAPQPPHPPFKKQWSSAPIEQVASLARIGRLLCYGTFSAYGAIDLRTGKSRWQVTLPDKYASSEVATDGAILYVEVGNKALLACRPDTGRVLWSRPHKGWASPMLARGHLLFCESPDGVLRAINTRTGAPRWTRTLEKPSKKNRDMNLALSTQPLLMGYRLFASTDSGRLICLDAATGAVLYQAAIGTSADDWVIGLVSDESRVYGTTRAGELIAWSAQGQTLWRFRAADGAEGPPILLNGSVCFTAEDGRLYAVDAATGRQRWARRLSTEADPTFSPLAVSGGTLLVATRSSVLAFNAHGKRLWTWDAEQDLTGEPLVVLPDGLLFTSNAFTRVVMGRPAGLPTSPVKRRALAQRLMGGFHALTEDQQHTLDKLGDTAFEVLLPLVQKRLAAFEKAEAAERTGGKDSFPLYEKFSDVMERLTAVASPKRTAEMLSLLRVAHTADTRGPILQCLAAHGSEPLTIPVYIQTLTTEKHNWENRFNPTGISLTMLAQSRDPRAIQFLTAQLANPQADPEIRHAAYVNLARTGGAAGLQAVLAARDTRRSIQALTQDLDLDKLGQTATTDGSTPLLATQRDNSGVLWGLIVSGAAGSYRDLWLVRRDDTHWTDPFFTGVTLTPQGKFPPQWLAQFSGDPLLRQDSDGDGWTDRLEQRLGTNPQKADTDGDGLPDAEDRNPLTNASPTNETEQVLAAAFEARFRFIGERNVPCLVEFPKGIHPLALSGWDWLILPSDARTKPLQNVTQQGVAVVSFSLPLYDLAGAALPRKDAPEFILWNRDHSAAKLQIRTYYGRLNASGYDLLLRKFRGQWVVVQTQMVWVS